ncbi:hypothetical protein IF1G_09090 [Cordyceps javanica]|uniref:Uncharacterized protein n=1 Tax=Cordyceps javanica TaxID=43265 RepID=A0A545URC8_9HYPO|nr:hypothetical protein IF1G_09090 [Cordyceps javanica]
MLHPSTTLTAQATYFAPAQRRQPDQGPQKVPGTIHGAASCPAGRRGGGLPAPGSAVQRCPQVRGASRILCHVAETRRVPAGDGVLLCNEAGLASKDGSAAVRRFALYDGPAQQQQQRGRSQTCFLSWHLHHHRFGRATLETLSEHVSSNGHGSCAAIVLVS